MLHLMLDARVLQCYNTRDCAAHRQKNEKYQHGDDTRSTLPHMR